MSRYLQVVTVGLTLLGLCVAKEPACKNKGCCFPEQFESDVFTETQVSYPFSAPQKRVVKFTGNFDFKNGRVALLSKDVSIYLLANKNTTGIFTASDNGKKCKKSRMPWRLRKYAGCITKKMRFVGSSTLGKPGKRLDVMTFTSKQMLGRRAQLSITVTSIGCYPVSTVIVGRRRYRPLIHDPLLDVANFKNTINGIRDLDVFTLPASCKALL